MKTFLISCIFLITCFLASAQISNEVTEINELAIAGKFLPPPTPPDILEIHGCIVFINENKEEGKLPFVKVNAENAERMEGVFQMLQMGAYSAPVNPSSFVDPANKNPEAVKKSPVVSDGIAHVRFNLQNGPIQKGDYITISNEPGVGMKATESGFTVGVALENSDATEKPGLLKVRVMVRYEKM
ncbi:MAG: hypothetical protein POELPBGB_00998 [Bacteroidia bacterium]|nr:hypothetical protein [Bacteroidia bacterium]